MKHMKKSSRIYEKVQLMDILIAIFVSCLIIQIIYFIITTSIGNIKKIKLKKDFPKEKTKSQMKQVKTNN